MTNSISRPVPHAGVIPDALARHLSAVSDEDIASISSYFDRGADLVDAGATEALRRLRKQLLAKIGRLGAHTHLRNRLELLELYFEESCRDGQRGTPAHRATVFALLYFLKGFDRIPDSVPEVGLLDDAIIVQMVLQRYAATLRAHWLRQHRAWPADL